MKTRSRVIVLLCSLAAFAVAANAQEAENPFTVKLPEGYAAFTTKLQTVPSPDGEIRATNWISKAPTGEAIIVTMSQMPGRILDAEKMMGSTRDSLLKSLSATLESEQKREGELPAVRLLFKTPNAFFRSRLMVDDDRLYQILYVGRSEEQRSAPQVAGIFESFALTSH